MAVHAAGTSAGSGTSPTGLPSGSTPQSAFTNTITDGTVQWKFVALNVTGFSWDNYAYSLRINDSAFLNGFFGFLSGDAANTGTSYPKFGHFRRPKSITTSAKASTQLKEKTFKSSIAGSGRHSHRPAWKSGQPSKASLCCTLPGWPEIARMAF